MPLTKAQSMLLVEDDDNDVFFFERACQKVGMTLPLHRVRDGDEAMQYLGGVGKYADRQIHPFPGLVLLDLKMPRKDGFELISWVRSSPGLRRLPLIVLSSSKEATDVNRAYDLGANSYLVKPVRFEQLVAVMQQFQLYWLQLAELPFWQLP